MMKSLLNGMVIWAIFLMVGYSDARATTSHAQVDQIDVDNTAQNKRDRGGATVTPEDQSESNRDLALTRRIRQAIVADDTLSVNAHNIKVITAQGIVTLRGPVDSAQEKESIFSKAQKIAGEGNVSNQLEVKAK